MRDEGLEQGGDLLLLAAADLRGGFEKAADLQAGTGSSFLSSAVVVLTAE